MIKAGIIGASGYTGAELVRIIAGHPGVELVFATANQYKNANITDLYPNLTGIVELKFEAYEKGLADRVDVVFIGLPHGASMEVVPELAGGGAKIIDLSGDFRFGDAAVYESWYGVAHKAGGLLGRAVYGLPEFYREKIAETAFVSNPGCYPTGAALAIYPLIKVNMVHSKGVIIDSKSGASGAGRTPKHETLFSTVDENIVAYKVGGVHQHTPEIEMLLSEAAGEDVVVTFTPHLVPATRGILTTAYAAPVGRPTTGALVEGLNEFYAGEPFVKVLPEGKLPQTKAVAGSNYCHVGVAVDARADRVVVVSAIDNLVKGAAGQAVQNMNIMFGLDETMGLTTAGIYP